MFVPRKHDASIRRLVALIDGPLIVIPPPRRPRTASTRQMPHAVRTPDRRPGRCACRRIPWSAPGPRSRGGQLRADELRDVEVCREFAQCGITAVVHDHDRHGKPEIGCRPQRLNGIQGGAIAEDADDPFCRPRMTRSRAARACRAFGERDADRRRQAVAEAAAGAGEEPVC
jgi:hypothetical protein